MTCPKCGSKNYKHVDRREVYFSFVIFFFISGFTVLLYGIYKMVHKGNHWFVISSMIFLFIIVAAYHILEKVRGLDKTNKCTECGEFY